MTLLSRVLGLVRDVVIAHLIGAGATADVFLFANRIPNFLRRLFAEGAFSQAFVPVLAEYQQSGDINKPVNLLEKFLVLLEDWSVLSRSSQWLDRLSLLLYLGWGGSLIG